MSDASGQRCRLLLCLPFLLAGCTDTASTDSQENAVVMNEQGIVVECISSYGRYRLRFKPAQDGACHVPTIEVMK